MKDLSRVYQDEEKDPEILLTETSDRIISTEARYRDEENPGIFITEISYPDGGIYSVETNLESVWSLASD